jgi:hypothetical protein
VVLTSNLAKLKERIPEEIAMLPVCIIVPRDRKYVDKYRRWFARRVVVTLKARCSGSVKFCCTLFR